MARKKNLRNKKSDIKVVPDKESILSKLYNNKLLRSKVDNAIDEDVSYDDIIDLCKEYDLELSKSAITRYKSKRKEAIENGWDLGELIDKRKKVSATQIQKKENPMKELDSENYTPFELATQNVQTIYDDIQILDMIIQKGAKGLNFVETLDPALMIKAMETKDRITGNQLKGMSFIGLRELMIKQQAQDTAMTEVMLEFIPEDKHEEVLQRMEQLQEEFYKNLDLDEEGRKLKDTLDRVGYTI
ncbi:hypothetical protein qdsa001_176 [Staphylococcus phage qdsa001]|uniref:Uncharacterized protein n=6 Tax=Silviavirus TaxID=1857889 RepID=S4T8Z3_9CAUD|nr:hypothetical protein F422_gp068 [Staphylococcus phage SA11]YP_007677585.1 hypothetical protein QLX36_gp081 [Staphylococcus phage vB_SauM_Romulus]YP_008431215.1 hypothetical protein O151_gp094 [Staphylococcus phage vB_SauM_Remus]APC42990.1 hypothetical protein SAP1_125 [Staphylococcus phage StAP1]ARQ95932.1 hypothetical protein qdsa001_176 [Staphylococcus phage qdsa001]QQO38061.1 hypothetical protein LSA2308_00041 [Staphylococcus phage LSA2308]QVD57578.1 hypothetical protein PM56_033 [Staph